MPAKPNPSDQLTQWNQDLAKNQTQSAALTKDIDRLKNQIADLTKTLSDTNQKGQVWDKSQQGATQQQTDFTSYVQTKTKMLEATVADKAAVVKIKTDAKQALTDLGLALKNAQATATAKAQVWNDAKAVTAGKQDAYNSYAGLGAANDSVLKDLASLRTSADQKSASNDVAKAYFQVLVMADVLTQLNIPATAAYTTELNNRALDLATAGETEKVAKIASDQAAADVAQAQKDLDSARSAWRQKALDSIPSGGGVAAAPAPAAAAPAPAAPAAPVVAAAAPAAPAAGAPPAQASGAYPPPGQPSGPAAQS
jgi:chromosome segregation ATPase